METVCIQPAEWIQWYWLGFLVLGLIIRCVQTIMQIDAHVRSNELLVYWIIAMLFNIPIIGRILLLW